VWYPPHGFPPQGWREILYREEVPRESAQPGGEFDCPQGEDGTLGDSEGPCLIFEVAPPDAYALTRAGAPPNPPRKVVGHKRRVLSKTGGIFTKNLPGNPPLM